MTKLTDKNFIQATSRQLAAAYVLSSDEPLLVMEARDHVIQQAQQRGFEERALYSVGPTMKWEETIERCQSMSLFGGRTIIDIRLHDFKLGNAGTAALKRIAHSLSHDILVIISTPRVGPKERRSPWYKAISEVAECVSFWPPGQHAFVGWLQQRCRNASVNIERPALEALAERLEGNLLAAHQEITKLAALYPNTTINQSIIEEAVQNHARFDVFDIQRMLVSGNPTHILHLITVLEDSGEEPILVLWAITQFVRQLQKGHIEFKNGSAVKQALQKAGLRGPLPFQKACELAISRLKLADLNKALIQAAEVDKVLKTSRKESAWPRLQQICLRLGKACTTQPRPVGARA